MSFHQEFKLRTVIWEFGGELIPLLLDDVSRFVDGIPSRSPLLDPFERARCSPSGRAVVRDATFPIDHSGRRYPGLV